jgi:hypothetical protein
MTTIPTRAELEAICDLPKHIPGKSITVTLAQLPDYLAVNNLQPDGMSAGGVLQVKKETEQE